MQLTNTIKNNIGLMDVYNTYFYRVYTKLSSAEEYYPSFNSWYYDKVVPDILNNKRNLNDFDKMQGSLLGAKYNDKDILRELN